MFFLARLPRQAEPLLVVLIIVLGGCETLRGWREVAADAPRPDALAGSVWTRNEQTPTEDGYVWRNAQLSASLAELDSEQLAGWLDLPSPVEAANAAIELARRGDARGSDLLLRVAANEKLPFRVRCSALETCQRICESRHDIDSSEIPLQLAADPSSAVRVEFVKLLASSGHQEAFSHIRRATEDADMNVRLAAIGTLGKFADSPHRAAAQQAAAIAMNHEGELVRAAAVSALALLDDASFRSAAQDSHWRVRSEVARALKDYKSADMVPLAQHLLRDSSAMVQRQAVESLASWPIGQAGPLLLLAMEQSSVLARSAASTQLAKRWPAAEGFSVNRPAAERSAALALLRQKWEAAYGALSETPSLPPSNEPRRLDPNRVARAEALLTSIARRDSAEFEELVEFGPDLPMVLEHLVLSRRRALPEQVYHDVLPRWDSQFEVLERLAEGDAVARVQAARVLAEGKPLSPLAAQRLVHLVTSDAHDGVWRGAMSALENDASPVARRLFLAAASSPHGEIRRRACEYLGTFADPSHAETLVARLEDQDPAVVFAAVEALGRCGASASIPSLENLLHSPDETLTLEVATSLVRLGSPRGNNELERLAHSTDANTRRQVAERMGRLARKRDVATLVRLLDDPRLGVQTAALEGLEKVAGQSAPPKENGKPASSREKADYWKRWARDRQLIPPRG